MKIYLLKRTDRGGYDEYDSFVVAAETDAEARKLAADNAGDEGGSTWLSPDLSGCRELEAGEQARIILGSFNAG